MPPIEFRAAATATVTTVPERYDYSFSYKDIRGYIPVTGKTDRFGGGLTVDARYLPFRLSDKTQTLLGIEAGGSLGDGHSTLMASGMVGARFAPNSRYWIDATVGLSGLYIRTPVAGNHSTLGAQMAVGIMGQLDPLPVPVGLEIVASLAPEASQVRLEFQASLSRNKTRPHPPVSPIEAYLNSAESKLSAIRSFFGHDIATCINEGDAPFVADVNEFLTTGLACDSPSAFSELKEIEDDIADAKKAGTPYTYSQLGPRIDQLRADIANTRLQYARKGLDLLVGATGQPLLGRKTSLRSIYELGQSVRDLAQQGKRDEAAKALSLYEESLIRLQSTFVATVGQLPPPAAPQYNPQRQAIHCLIHGKDCPAGIDPSFAVPALKPKNVKGNVSWE